MQNGDGPAFNGYQQTATQPITAVGRGRRVMHEWVEAERIEDGLSCDCPYEHVNQGEWII